MCYIFKQLDKNQVTENDIHQILSLEGDDGYSEEQIRNIWQNTNIVNHNFVCRQGNNIIGNISFNPNSKRRNGSVYMVNLSVSPQHRRKGIAQNLIYTACKFYKDLNSTLRMSLSVDKDNSGAICLYKKVGYKIVEPVCEADIDDEQYIMESSLTNLINNCENIIEGKSK